MPGSRRPLGLARPFQARAAARPGVWQVCSWPGPGLVPGPRPGSGSGPAWPLAARPPALPGCWGILEHNLGAARFCVFITYTTHNTHITQESRDHQRRSALRGRESEEEEQRGSSSVRRKMKQRPEIQNIGPIYRGCCYYYTFIKCKRAKSAPGPAPGPASALAWLSLGRPAGSASGRSVRAGARPEAEPGRITGLGHPCPGPARPRPRLGSARPPACEIPGGVRASSSLSGTLLYISLHVGSLCQGGLYIRMSLNTLLCARLYIYNIKSTTAPRRATTHHATHDGSRR